MSWANRGGAVAVVAGIVLESVTVTVTVILAKSSGIMPEGTEPVYWIWMINQLAFIAYTLATQVVVVGVYANE